MPQGSLEVVLFGARGLDSTDLLTNMDPYVVLTYRTQEKKSTVASGKGTTPEWNETFLFTVSGDDSKLVIKIMDSDGLTEDDFVGEAVIPLHHVFEEGSIPPAPYRVVKDEQFCGEIKVGLTFTEQIDRGFEPSFGGWKQSSMD